VPRLSVGLHLNLTTGARVCPPEAVPTLCDPRTGRFRPLAQLVARALLGRVAAGDVARECAAQIERARTASGCRVAPGPPLFLARVLWMDARAAGGPRWEGKRVGVTTFSCWRAARAGGVAGVASLVTAVVLAAQGLEPRFGLAIARAIPVGEYHALASGLGFNAGWQAMGLVVVTPPTLPVAVRLDATYGANSGLSLIHI